MNYLHHIIAKAIYLITAQFLQQFYHCYELTIALPHTTGATKNSCLDDLIEWQPPILAAVRRLLPDSFGCWVRDRKADRWSRQPYKFFHTHALIISRTPIYSLSEMTAELLAVLPEEFRTREKGRVINLEPVEDMYDYTDYMGEHEPTETTRQRYGQFRAKSSWGNWPTADEIAAKIADAEDEEDEENDDDNVTFGNTFEKIFSALMPDTAYSASRLRESESAAPRAHEEDMHESDPVSDQSSPSPEPEKNPRAENSAADPFDLSDPDDLARIQRLRAAELSAAFIAGGPSAVRELLDLYELYARIVRESGDWLNEIAGESVAEEEPENPPAQHRRPQAEERTEDKPEARQALKPLPLSLFLRWMFPNPRGPGPPIHGTKQNDWCSSSYFMPMLSDPSEPAFLLSCFLGIWWRLAHRVLLSGIQRYSRCSPLRAFPVYMRPSEALLMAK